MLVFHRLSFRIQQLLQEFARYNGDQVNGALTAGDLDVFTLPVLAGEQVHMQLVDDAGATYFTPALEVFASDGSLIAESSGVTVASTNYLAAADDELKIFVRDNYVNIANYDYKLTSHRSIAGFMVPLGDEGGVLSNGISKTGVAESGDLDVYSLAVSAGDILSFSLMTESN